LVEVRTLVFSFCFSSAKV